MDKGGWHAIVGVSKESDTTSQLNHQGGGDMSASGMESDLNNFGEISEKNTLAPKLLCLKETASIPWNLIPKPTRYLVDARYIVKYFGEKDFN